MYMYKGSCCRIYKTEIQHLNPIGSPVMTLRNVYDPFSVEALKPRMKNIIPGSGRLSSLNAFITQLKLLYIRGSPNGTIPSKLP